MGSTKLKEAFDVGSKHGAFYTGGNVQWIEDTIYCQTDSVINLLNIENGSVIQSIGGAAEEVEEIDTIHTFTTDAKHFVTSHKSGLLKLWDQDGTLLKMWKYIHKGPIAKLNLKDNILASGGSDSIIRIWDLEHSACLLALKGCQGVVSVVEYHPTENELLAVADDGKINHYKLDKGELKITYNAHYSKVTGIAFTHDNDYFISTGRDKVLILWRFGDGTPLKSIAVYEVIESIVSLPSKFKLPGFKSQPEDFYVASGGENGIIRVWDIKNAKEIYVQSNSLISKAEEEGGLAITHLIYNNKMKSIGIVTVEQNIIIHHLKSFVCLKQFIGFSDDILDIIIFGTQDTHLAVATNSKDIKVYDNVSMNCQILKGHEDVVLALAVSPFNRNLILSSGKDNTVRIWQLIDSVQITCIGVGKRHTRSVGALTFFNSNKSLFVSASHDTCLKLWTMPELIVDSNNKKLKEITTDENKTFLSCKQTVIAHDKDINCVTTSPNDKIVATASQDKTVKFWNSENLELIGILKGHRRGVWSIRFSPVDQVALSSSADCTIKLWSVADLTCLKTLEGHESSVLKAEFLSNGLQVLSAGADGLVRLYNIKDSECKCILDQHEGKIWALAIKSDESEFVTGGSDSLMIKWKDVTEDRRIARQKEIEQLALDEQKLSNYIQNYQLLKALKLALKLEKPMQTLKIIREIIKKGDSGLSITIKSLRNDQKDSLLNCAINWNMNSKNCHPAQLVINILMEEIQAGTFRPTGFNRITESALPYTERHFKRLTKMMQDIYLINYTIKCMQPYSRNIGE